MTDAILVLITAPAEEEGGRIAATLVDERLVACVNIVPAVRSIFSWQGKTQDEREVLLVCKSTAERMPAIIARVKQVHSYTVPEIIALPVIAGSTEYLQWVRESVQ